MSSDDEVQVVVPWDAPPSRSLLATDSHRQPPIAADSHQQPPIAADSRRNSLSTSFDDEVQVVVPWETLLKQHPIYNTAFSIFSWKAHKSPPLDKKRTMLLNIVSQPVEGYFLRGTSQADDFKRLKKQCYAGWTSESVRNKLWTVMYTAEKLALLLVLREQVDMEKKVRASSRTCGASPTNDIKRAYRDLFAVYSTCLDSYNEKKRTEGCKSVRLPSLDRQLNGPLLQYKFPWNQANKDSDACPCCLHSMTMPVESRVEVNAKNRELRTKASENGGDGKFKAISALHGCYCYHNNCRGHEQGYGCTECKRKAADGETLIDCGPGVCGFDCVICDCDCKCVFQEHNRGKIGIGILQEDEAGGDGGGFKVWQ